MIPGYGMGNVIYVVKDAKKYIISLFLVCLTVTIHPIIDDL